MFGLSQKYYSDKWLSHNPEQFVDLQMLSEGVKVADISLSHTNDAFHSYLNENSFLLEEWY